MVLRIVFPKRTIVVGTGDKPEVDNRCVLVRHVKQRAYRVWSRCRTQTDWEEYRVARRYAQLVYDDAVRTFITLDEYPKSTKVVVYY